MINGYVLERTEDAWKNYISSSLSSSYSSSINYYHGTQFQDEDGKLGPALIVSCPGCEEVMFGTGVYRTQAQIMLAVPFVNTGSQAWRNELVTSMSTVILGNDNILTNLSESTQRMMFLDATFGGQQNSFAGDTIITTYQIDMVVRQTA